MTCDGKISKTNDSESLKEGFLENVSSVSATDDERNTPLHLTHDPHTVKFLLAHGADVNAKNINGFTPLHLAPTATITRLLLEAGANPNAAASSGRTPLCLARTLEQARLLVTAGANVCGNTFTTPLHHVRTVEMAHYLISQGADVNKCDRFSRTPIFSAPSPVLQFLLTQGANPNWNDFQGQTPLFFVSDLEAAKQLLAYGADVNHTSRFNTTPVESITSKQILHLLVQNGGRVSNRRYSGLLHEVNDPRLLELYLAAKAKVNAVNKQGQAPLHAVKNFQCAVLLLKYGARINQLDRCGRSPVFYVSTPDLLLLYLEHGANLHISDNSGATPLHHAKSPEIAQLLISQGLSVHARDSRGNTPFHYHFRNQSVARVLLENGADINACNNDGIAPIHLAQNVRELAFLYYHEADLAATVNDDKNTSIFYLSDDPAMQQFIRNHKIPIPVPKTSGKSGEMEDSEERSFQEYMRQIPPDLLAIIDSGNDTYFQFMLDIYATNDCLQPLFYYLFLNKKYDLCEVLIKNKRFSQELKDKVKPMFDKRPQETGLRKLFQLLEE